MGLIAKMRIICCVNEMVICLTKTFFIFSGCDHRANSACVCVQIRAITSQNGTEMPNEEISRKR